MSINPIEPLRAEKVTARRLRQRAVMEECLRFVARLLEGEAMSDVCQHDLNGLVSARQLEHPADEYFGPGAGRGATATAATSIGN